MKKFLRVFTQSPRHRKRLLILPALLLALCLLPVTAKADVTEIILFLRQIETTLQGAIGQVLSEIQTAENTLNTLHQQLVWPLNEINQAKAFVSGTINHYKGLLAQIRSIQVESATLVNPSHLENAFRSSAQVALANIQPTYTKVYSPIPTDANAHPLDRNMMDMDDAAAVASLKSTSISDQNTDQMLDLADVIELRAGGSAPGSAPIISAQAQIANLETQAQMAKLLAAELRLEAAKLAHDNALLKRSAQHKGVLQQQMQQVGVTP